jgi:hypothetical protein
MNTQWFMARARERSTWTGLLAIIAALGWEFTPAMQEQLVGVLLGLGGLIWVGTKDKTDED